MSELPEGWQVALTAEACALVQSGGTPKAGFIAAAGIPFLKVYNIVDQRVSFEYKPQFVAEDVHKGELRKSRIRPGDVLMNIVGPPLGKVAIVPETYPEWNANQAITVFRPSAAVSTDWLYHFLCGGSSVQSVINETRGSAGQVNISLTQCRNFEIPLPPPAEQRRIVAKIDSLTGKSRRARDHLDHIPRLVEKYKQAVLAAAFRGISSNGPSRKLGDLAEFITSGSRGWAKYYSDHGSLFIRVANVMRGGVELSFSDTQHVSPPDGAEGQRTSVRPGDIVVTITADLGRVGLIPSDLGSAYVNQHVALVRLQDPDLGPFIAWYLTSEIGQRQMLEQNRGMTRSGLGLDDIRNVTLPLPSVAEQRKTVELIEAAHSWIDRLASEATSARRLVNRLDQAVLAKAFRGELVPQDPEDEPASVLLDRIRAERGASPKAKRGRKAKAT